MTQENILPEAAQGKKLIIFGVRNFGKLLANTLQQNALDFAYFVDNCPRGGVRAAEAGVPACAFAGRR